MFRLHGSNEVIKALKEPLDTEDDVCLVSRNEHFDVDAVVSPLKNTFESLNNSSNANVKLAFLPCIWYRCLQLSYSV